MTADANFSPIFPQTDPPHLLGGAA